MSRDRNPGRLQSSGALGSFTRRSHKLVSLWPPAETEWGWRLFFSLSDENVNTSTTGGIQLRLEKKKILKVKTDGNFSFGIWEEFLIFEVNRIVQSKLS